MVATAVEICNLALSHLGLGTITSLTAENESARKCSIFYTQARDSVLVDHEWNFATSRTDLAEVSNETTFEEWAYVYGYPTKALRVLRVYPSGADSVDSPDPFKVEQGSVSKNKVILSNVQDALVKYIYQVSDVTLYSAQFVNALSYYLAYLLAGPLTDDPKKIQTMYQLYTTALGRAMQINSDESITDRNRTSDIENARG